MTKKKSISVVLPNYNGQHLMELYIPSTIEALQFSQIDFEFIVVDDCSKDNSVAFIEKEYPNIILLKNDLNSGFSKTCNKGISYASKDLVFLLNSDVKLTQKYFEQQLKYFEMPSTFGVMGRIMNFDGEKMEDTARVPYYKGAKFKADKFFYLEDDQKCFTCYLSGANALIDRRKINFLNGLNEIYTPFYFEDFDLGLRAWKMGWHLYYNHESICYHEVSSSTNAIKNSNSVKIIYNRNSFILQSIHLNGSRRIFWHLQLFTNTLIGHILKGEFWIFSSLFDFLSNSTEIKKARLDIKELKKASNQSNNLDDIITIIGQSIKNKNVKWI